VTITPRESTCSVVVQSSCGRKCAVTIAARNSLILKPILSSVARGLRSPPPHHTAIRASGIELRETGFECFVNDHIDGFPQIRSRNSSDCAGGPCQVSSEAAAAMSNSLLGCHACPSLIRPLTDGYPGGKLTISCTRCDGFLSADSTEDPPDFMTIHSRCFPTPTSLPTFHHPRSNRPHRPRPEPFMTQRDDCNPNTDHSRRPGLPTKTSHNKPFSAPPRDSRAVGRSFCVMYQQDTLVRW